MCEWGEGGSPINNSRIQGRIFQKFTLAKTKNFAVGECYDLQTIFAHIYV